MAAADEAPSALGGRSTSLDQMLQKGPRRGGQEAGTSTTKVRLQAVSCLCSQRGSYCLPISHDLACVATAAAENNPATEMKSAFFLKALRVPCFSSLLWEVYILVLF